MTATDSPHSHERASIFEDLQHNRWPDYRPSDTRNRIKPKVCVDEIMLSNYGKIIELGPWFTDQMDILEIPITYPIFVIPFPRGFFDKIQSKRFFDDSFEKRLNWITLRATISNRAFSEWKPDGYVYSRMVDLALFASEDDAVLAKMKYG